MGDILLLLSRYQRRIAPCWRRREHFAHATASSLIGALYVWSLHFAKKINNLLPIVIAVGAALAILVIKLIAIPALISISISPFAIASARTSALTVAKAFGYIVGPAPSLSTGLLLADISNNL